MNERKFEILDANHVSFMIFPSFGKPRRVEKLVTKEEMDYVKQHINDSSIIESFCYSIA